MLFWQAFWLNQKPSQWAAKKAEVIAISRLREHQRSHIDQCLQVRQVYLTGSEVIVFVFDILRDRRELLRLYGIDYFECQGEVNKFLHGNDNRNMSIIAAHCGSRRIRARIVFAQLLAGTNQSPEVEAAWLQILLHSISCKR